MFKDDKLNCDMTEMCDAPVTHIDVKGYVYCTKHGEQRKSVQRCRKLKPAELKKLESGEALSRY